MNNLYNFNRTNNNFKKLLKIKSKMNYNMQSVKCPNKIKMKIKIIKILINPKI